MKYKVIEIKNFPLREEIKKLDITERQFAIEANITSGSLNPMVRDKLIVREKTAKRLIKVLEKFKNNPQLVEEKKEISKERGRRMSIVSEKEKEEMIKMRLKGRTLEEIGEHFYGLTKERARQIIDIPYVELRRRRIKIKS